MFFEKNLLTRRGKFGIIWIAATRPTGLKKRDYMSVNVQHQCHSLQEHIKISGISKQNKNSDKEGDLVKFSLYLSAQLMYGVVRVFLHQHSYLLDDVNSAMLAVRARSSKSINANHQAAVDVNLVDDGLLPPPNERCDPSDFLLLQQINTPYGLPSWAPLEVTTDLESHITSNRLNLSPLRDIIDELNRPIENDGFEPQDPLMFFGIDAENIPVGEAMAFNKLSPGKYVSKCLTEADLDVPVQEPAVVSLINEENHAATSEPIRVVKKRLVNGVLRDQLESNVSRMPHPKLPKYVPENRFVKHNFTYKRNFPSHYWQSNLNLAKSYFDNRVIPLDIVKSDLGQNVALPVLDDLIFDAFIGQQGHDGFVNETEELEQPRGGSRAGSVRSADATIRLSNFPAKLKDVTSRSKDKSHTVTIDPNATLTNLPAYEEAVLDAAMIDSSDLQATSKQPYLNFSLLFKILIVSSDTPREYLKRWIAESFAGSEELFTAFCPLDTTTRKQAGLTFFALLVATKQSVVTLRQSGSYEKISICKL